MGELWIEPTSGGNDIVIKNTSSAVTLPGYVDSLYHLQAGQIRLNYFPSLCLSFLIYEMEMLTVPLLMGLL